MPDTQQPPATELALLNARLGVLHEDVSEMRASLRTLADAITKLALVEQQQQQSSAALERCFSLLEKLDTRLSLVEAQLPMLSRTNVWVERGVLATVGAAVMYVAKKAGFFN